jgi:exopolysaccharide biosynthesis polyprenyl glycosylphosphotransferase
LISVFCYATQAPIARGFVLGLIPVGVGLMLTSRLVVRGFVNGQRREGLWSSRMLAVGTSESVRQLLLITRRASSSGLRIVGACVEDAEIGSMIDGVPVVGGVLGVASTAERIDADVVAVAGEGLGSSSIRELGWALEGSGRGLIISPALTEIAGPRVTVSPVEGLPLMWLERPQLGRLPRLVKRSMDIAGSLIGLLIISPVLIVTAIAIKSTSRGPVFFKQRRIGVNGTEFTIFKFRSMVVDAEAKRVELMEQNEQDGGGVLFKMRRDPRITSVGRVIRAFSIDELPQLLNILAGQMSLIGPRPLAACDSNYEGRARRRLLVRPGLTGLWQVSGRSELSWDDAVRLDLYYVEHWSFGLDITILVRTISAVLARKGAF